MTIEALMETSDGSKKRIRVPSAQGGTDRTIYVNGSDSGYKLGQNNDRVYTKHGREVSGFLKDFVKNILGVRTIEGVIYIFFFIAKFSYFV
ncbi:MAG: hypothetical protein AB7E37_05600 [Candidatus Altimarinota bacterium]